MIKAKELTDHNSCMMRAKPDEEVFVLLARDAAAPATIRFWARERVRIGKNVDYAPQIRDAYDCARVMDRQRDEVKYLPQEQSDGDAVKRLKDENTALIGRIQQFDAAIRRIAHNVGAVCGRVNTEGDGPGGHTAAEIIKCIDDIRNKRKGPRRKAYDPNWKDVR